MEHSSHHHDETHPAPSLSNAEGNRRFWDSISTDFYGRLENLPDVCDMYEILKEAILHTAQFNAETTEVMDFACGTGALSHRIAPYVKSIAGVDISSGMAAAYNSAMQTKGITNAHAISAELKEGENEVQLKNQKFDVIFCAQSYKHISDNVAISKALKSYLKPNGILMVIDIIKGRANPGVVIHGFHEMVTGMREHAQKQNVQASVAMTAHMKGYLQDDMEATFEAAGFKEFGFREVFSKKKDEAEFALFLAKGLN